MFGLSLWEIGVATLVAFLIFGPEQFPVMIRQIMDSIKKAKDFALQAQQTFSNLSSDLESTINDSLEPIKSSPLQHGLGHSTKGRESSHEPLLDTISLDMVAENYEPQKINWKECVEIDADASNYQKDPHNWKKQSET